jgi:hypothetical protein
MAAASSAASVYRVAIRHNIVAEISICPSAGIVVHSDPLVVSTVVAQRMQRHGCIDGEYHFADLSMARHFAELSMDFAGKVVARTAQEIARAAIHQGGWMNPLLPP